MIARTPSPAARQAFLLPLVAVAVILGGSFALFSGCGLQTSGIPSDTADAGSACVSNAQCDDSNPCTTDTCNASGECESAPVKDGPAPGAEQKQGTCKQVVCKDGESATVADPSNAPKSTDMCTVATCDGETPKVTAAPDGTMCELNGAPSVCTKGKCAHPCTTSADCPSTGPCQTAACNGETGMCEYTNVTDGTPTPGVTDPTGDCKQHLCLMGKDTDAPDDADIPMVPVSMAGCATAKCDNGTPEFPLNGTDSQCSTWMGTMSGFCSAAGECTQCTQDSECAGTGTNDDCQHPACQSGVCKQAFTAMNTPITSQTLGDCQSVVCDGSGNTTTIPDPTDFPSDPTGCNPWSCSGTTPVHGTSANGTGCGSGLSCSNGMCSGCTTNAQCQSGGAKPNAKCNAPNCVCTPSTCPGLGLTCGSAPDGCGGMLSCSDGKQDGTETGTDCGGNTSQCAARCGQGAGCKVTSDCGSGLTCVSGICCNQACAGACEACTAAGVCQATAQGQPDPKGTCQSQSASTCGEEGATCNGSGACTTWPTGTVCQAASCSGTTFTKQDTCIGGTCTAGNPSMVSCTPYKCSGSACATSCTQDSDCFSSGFYCGSGQCLAKLTQSTACAGNDQCQSGFCVSGFCCNMACGGQCQACSAALTGGTNGTCTSVKAGTADPSGSCTDQGAASCKNDGKCTSTAMCEQYVGGTPCSAGSCTGGMGMAGGTCNGTGMCMGGTPTPCAPYTCNGTMTACLTSCGSDSDCVGGDYCNGSVCQARAANGGTCTGTDGCTSGICGPNGICCSGTCTDMGPSSCKNDGNCVSGTGACEKYASGTTCSHFVTCSGSSQTVDEACDGAGNCNSDATPVPCPNNLKCNGAGGCKASCSSVADCVSGFFCVGGACVASNAGATCSGASDCSSSLCKGSVCCASACSTDATCGATSCAANTGACVYPPAYTACSGTHTGFHCSSSTQNGAICDGSGTCQNLNISCPSTCSGSDCCDNCATDADCSMWGYCSSGTCKAQGQTGASCSAGNQCLSGTCTGGACQ